MTETLSSADWHARRSRHIARLQSWVAEHLGRSARQQKHPVYDFLFEYYSFRPAHLLRWSPGIDVLLEGAGLDDLDWRQGFSVEPGGAILRSAAFPQHRLDYLRWATQYLEAIAARPPHVGCYGLHEWAMVYRTPEVRHSAIPLRLAAEEVHQTVETLGPCCTHYDAFRFFTPAAMPLNRHELDRQSTDRFDQPGCIHVCMDLYKFAYKIAPFIPSELIADALDIARKARVIDMRASPYDLRPLGLIPIAIESAAGRAEYVELQRQLARESAPLRARILDAYRRLLESLGGG